MKNAFLEDICHIVIGKTPLRSQKEYWGKGNKWLSISDMQNKYIYETKEEITDKGVMDCNCKLIPEDTLLLSFKLSIGKMAFNKVPLFTNEAIVALTIKDENMLNKHYLYYALKSVDLLASTDRAVKGATLNKEKLRRIKVPITDLIVQERIVGILDKAQSLIDKRKQTIAELNKLIMSVFYTSFADNSLADRFELKECIEIPLNAGWSPVCSQNNQGIPVFSLANLTGEGLSTKITKFYDENLPTKGSDLKAGDIVISRSNTRDLVGRVGLYEGTPSRVIYPDLMIRIRIKQDYLNSIYFFYYLISISKVIRNLAHGSNESMVKISQSKLLSIPVIIPPKALQDKFAEQVQNIKDQKQRVQEHLEQLEQNFDSLLHRAFTGQLNINDPITIGK
ncbi:type I restriction enzyme S subunit [Croceifilum oryzae]|uniref:Type I restriction enzyme S subunit n=1 Tax=Croceifilum oryzae TaxID=1553429 RepID=A0AAJ1TEV7_9BACL|nr:restriction endonuclease subunit S [Croceifilum oryzae]MDQ0417603.1 type I restriction enzyme S subunit [Croceifilum oryzae]